MEIEWDPNKAQLNYTKHGVCFFDAEAVLFDPNALTIEDTRAEGEQRFVTMGSSSNNRILVVVYTYRGVYIRIISARPATRQERKNYEEGI